MIKRPYAEEIYELENIFSDTLPVSIHHNVQPIKISYFNFICTFINLLEDYVRSNVPYNFNMFIIDSYIHKEISNLQIYRHFHGFLNAWKTYGDHRQDPKLFFSLLKEGRNNKEFVKWFLKLRKTILKNISSKILEEIFITHGDALTICHMLFDEKNRTKISKKINDLFINLKRKMINTAKINGAKSCEFFLNVKEEIEGYPPLKQLDLETNKKPLNNINLSFSEQFASFYERKQHSSFLSDMDYVWRKQNKGTHFEMVRNEFDALSQKDKEMDAKLWSSGFLKMKESEENDNIC